MKHLLGFLFALSFLPSSQAALLTWADLNIGETLVLKENLKLDSSLLLKAGSQFQIRNLTNLGPVGVVQYELDLTPCPPALDQSSLPMVILDKLYGFEMQNHGATQFYVEIKDLGRPSFFEAKLAQP